MHESMIYFCIFLQSNIEQVSYKPTNDLTLQPHDPVHSDFTPYVELMKWLKDLDNSKYMEIKSVCKIPFHWILF